jgi:hypothetical protein
MSFAAGFFLIGWSYYYKYSSPMRPAPGALREILIFSNLTSARDQPVLNFSAPSA